MCRWSLSLLALAHGAWPCTSVGACLNATLWHIPGPNPIVAPTGAGEWMSTECEIAGGATEANGTFYLLYHCLGSGGYRVGVSTAPSPLGPWTPPAASPVLDVTPGGWDNHSVASMNLLPDPARPGAWLGFYEGGHRTQRALWSVGLARADSPLGPWRKDPRNPVLQGAAACDPSREFHGVCNGTHGGLRTLEAKAPRQLTQSHGSGRSNQVP